MEDFGKGGGEKENSVQKDTEEYIGKLNADSKKGETGRGGFKEKVQPVRKPIARMTICLIQVPSSL